MWLANTGIALITHIRSKVICHGTVHSIGSVLYIKLQQMIHMYLYTTISDLHLVCERSMLEQDYIWKPNGLSVDSSAK